MLKVFGVGKQSGIRFSLSSPPHRAGRSFWGASPPFRPLTHGRGLAYAPQKERRQPAGTR